MAHLNHQDVSLPENLKRQFASLENRLWKVETAMAVCLAFSGLALSYLGLFVSDRIWDSPIWLRMAAAATGLSIMAIAIFRWIRLWFLKRRDMRALAILVQRRFRVLGDRLLGIVELANEKTRPANFSPELYRAAIRQVADEAEKYNFREAIDKRRAKRLISIAIGLVILIALPALIVPAASQNVFQRWLTPAAAIERFTLVRIQGLPPSIVVPHGENFQVTGDVTYESFWKPTRALARFSSDFRVEAKAQEGKLQFQLPGQIQKNAVKIKIGDYRTELLIEPAYRPALKQLATKIEYPDYLQYPPVEDKVQSGSLSVLESSHVTFAGKVSRALESASLHNGKDAVPIEVTGDDFKTTPIVTDGVTQLSFTWRDKLGLSNASPWRLNIHKQRDQPPSPDLPDLSRDVAILQSDVIKIKALAKDDFGVREVGLSWEVMADSDERMDWSVTETKVEQKTARQKRAEEMFQWSPVIFRVPEDTAVELVGFAIDYFPGRERVESLPHRIHVLGKEQHAELVRQNLESVLARVEEVARMQEKVLSKTAELREDEKLSPKDAADKIGKAGEEQQQNSRNLDNLAKEGMDALREAMKNPIFKEAMLQEWAKTMQQMQNLSEGKMKEAAGDLKSAQQKASDADSKKQDLAQAEKKMEDALQELEQIQGKVNKNLDDLQALTLSERLRKLSGTEAEISTELKKILPQTIGLLPAELPDRFKRVDAKMATIQESAQKEAQLLQGEINRFYERTQKPNYGEVSRDMNEKRTAEELEALREMIKENIAMEATRSLTVWSERLGEWAKKLEPPPSESGEGTGEGGEPPNMTKVLIQLIRMRDKEGILHTQTETLEEQKPALKNYEESAQMLAAIQGSLKENLLEIEQENTVPILAQPIKETVGAMDKVEGLLKMPLTGSETLAAEVKTVEALTDLINLINEQAQRNPPPPSPGGEQSESEQMAFLMQMMQPQPGEGQPMPMTQPGGNPQGGTTDRAAQPLSGDSTGRSAEERRVNKASGAASLSVPVEFRETLENYFKALEQEPN